MVYFACGITTNYSMACSLHNSMHVHIISFSHICLGKTGKNVQEIQTVVRMTVTMVKAYFLCYIYHNVSILVILAKLLSRLLAMQESYRYIYFIHTLLQQHRCFLVVIFMPLLYKTKVRMMYHEG